MGCHHSKAEAPLQEVIPTKAEEDKRGTAPQKAAAKPAKTADSAQVRTEKPNPQDEAEKHNENTKVDVADNSGIKAVHGASVGDMETRASSFTNCEEDAALRAEQIIEDALNDAREHLDDADFLNAERILMTALESLQSQGSAGNAYVEKLRKSEVYQKTLEELRAYERKVREAVSPAGSDGDDTPWKLAAEIELDYRRLGIELSPEAAAQLTKEDRMVSFYWRVTKDKRAQVRATACLPTTPANAPTGTNMMMAWLAMTSENDLVHTWHPIVVGDGPTMLPNRSKYRFTWLSLIKILLLKHAQMEEATNYANEETGTLVTSVRQAGPKEEIWKSFPPPSGYTPDPMVAKLTVVCAPQKHTTYFTGMNEIVSERPLPGFLVKLMATWLLPEMIRRMFAGIMRCLSPDGPYAARIAADPYGIYGQTRPMVETGARVDEAGHYEGKTLGAHNVPTPEQICARAKSLVKFEDSLQQ